jgi:3-oxoacyl-(acyl-carrier-protein) synthase
MRRRVVITGLGCISPVGNNVPDMWEHILNGVSGVGYITHFDPSEHKSKIAAEVKGFDGSALFGSRSRRMDRLPNSHWLLLKKPELTPAWTLTDSNRIVLVLSLDQGLAGSARYTSKCRSTTSAAQCALAHSWCP